MSIEDTKLNVEFAALGARIPWDCCHVLDDDDWSALADLGVRDALQLAVMAINAALLKTRPGAQVQPFGGESITRLDVISAYENALRQGFGTRPQRGALLSDELGI